MVPEGVFQYHHPQLAVNSWVSVQSLFSTAIDFQIREVVAPCILSIKTSSNSLFLISKVLRESQTHK